MSDSLNATDVTHQSNLPKLPRMASSVGQNLVLAVIGWLLTLCVFWPGWMSFDSSAQYAQVLSGAYDDVHPPLMAAIWSLTDRWMPGPGGLFALHALAFWLGLVCVLSMYLRGWRLGLAALMIGSWPPIALMVGHVWKDIGMVAALLLALAAALRWRHYAGRGWWLAAFLGLAVAAAYRHNALAACLPLMLLMFRRAEGQRRLVPVLQFVLAAGVLLVLPSLLSRALTDEHKQAWPAVAIFDIAAVSIATNQQRVPIEISAADLSVEDLRQHFKPWANPSVFETGKIRLSFFVPYGPRESNAVARAWFDAIREQPRAWLAHRWRLSKYLLFGPPAEAPRELAIVPMMLMPATATVQVQAADNAIVAAYVRFADRFWHTSVFWAAPYLALSLLIAIIAWRRAPRRWTPTLVLALSAWANALPLALISGSAEARYLLWTQVATLIALAWLLGQKDQNVSLEQDRSA